MTGRVRPIKLDPWVAEIPMQGEAKLCGFSASQLLDLKRVLDERGWSLEYMLTVVTERWPTQVIAWREHFGILADLELDQW